MDVGSIGAQYLDQNRFSAESLGIVRRNAAGNSAREGGGLTEESFSGDSFADLLKKAQNKETETPASPAVNSHKTHIDKTSKLYEQCEALEGFLVKTLITGMRNTVQKSNLIDEGFAGKMYEDMLYDEYTRDFTKNANFGLAEIAYLELTGQRGKLIADHI
ncbi:flagellar protein [Spirochaetia bacterium]|nr:flagellar protein [Spirochaetia bacterium]